MVSLKKIHKERLTPATKNILRTYLHRLANLTGSNR